MESESQSPNQSVPSDGAAEQTAQWKPLNARQRRVLGTLMEKAKTTPDVYPMTFLGLKTGCNQKSNRAPQMDLSLEQVETVIEELRAIGAAAEVFGNSRVAKVRHYAYDWLGIKGAGAGAVMTELLCRGEQTLGDLRARASRMEPIPDQAALQEILEGLMAKNLVVALTPSGRGQIVTHNLYLESELESLRKQYANYVGASDGGGDTASSSSSSSSAATSRAPLVAQSQEVALLQEELALLKDEVSDLRARLEKVEQLLQ